MKMRRTMQRVLPLGLCLLCGVVAAADGAAPAASTDARPGFSPTRPAGLFELPPLTAADPAAAAEGPAALVLRQVLFHGNSVVSTADLDALAAPHIGRNISAAEIETLRIALTRLYVDRGYVNSGLRLKRVDAAQGRLEFDVVEGRLSSVELLGMERLDDAYVVAQLQRPDDGHSISTSCASASSCCWPTRCSSE